MHTNTPHEKAPAPTKVAGALDNTNDLNFPTGQRERKAFATLMARFAPLGYHLTRSDPADGAVIFIVARWGLSRAFTDLDTLGRFLAQNGRGV